MIVTIIPIEDHAAYTINGHIIKRCGEDNWIIPNCLVSLSATERKAFQTYLKVVVYNDRFKTHPKSTYKTH